MKRNSSTFEDEDSEDADVDDLQTDDSDTDGDSEDAAASSSCANSGSSKSGEAAGSKRKTARRLRGLGGELPSTGLATLMDNLVLTAKPPASKKRLALSITQSLESLSITDTKVREKQSDGDASCGTANADDHLNLGRSDSKIIRIYNRSHLSKSLDSINTSKSTPSRIPTFVRIPFPSRPIAVSSRISTSLPEVPSLSGSSNSRKKSSSHSNSSRIPVLSRSKLNELNESIRPVINPTNWIPCIPLNPSLLTDSTTALPNPHLKMNPEHAQLVLYRPLSILNSDKSIDDKVDNTKDMES